MKEQYVDATLKGLAGHLVIETADQIRNFKLLEKSLAQSNLDQDFQSCKKSDFTFEKSDLFFDEKIPKEHRIVLNKIATRYTKRKEEPRFKVFVREVPLREQLLQSSVPDWAAGGKVDHTVGPFVNSDGRQFWYDFFPIEKLITLYVEGMTEPALLFKTRSRRKLAISPKFPIQINLSKKYTLAKGTIWINAKLLGPNAPINTFTGLTIDGGTVELSKKATIVNDKLTAALNTQVSVELNLGQQEASSMDESAPYGKDARSMELSLPDHLNFHFSAQGRTIDSVGSASWRLYGQPIQFRSNSQVQVNYNPLIQRIVFPMNASESDIEIRESDSDFNEVQQTALIVQAGWALPVATIDISQPTSAGGTGAMMVNTGAGISNTWRGVNNGGLHLNNPVFLVGPNQIFIGDFTASNPHATVNLDLWKDDLNEFGTSVNLTFPTPTLFFYVSNVNGNELILCLTNSDFKVDRPVKVNGEPPRIRSLNSLLMIAVNATNRLIYLFDDNMIADDMQLSNQDPFIPKRMALAMTNALFKVSQPNGCLLFGSLSEDFEKIEQGFLFLTFGLFAYIPTLPDPYAANLGVLKRQLRGNGNIPGTAAASPINAWLVCRVQWSTGSPSDENDFDDVNVSFHFAPLNNQFAGISFENEEEEAEPTFETPGSVTATFEPNAAQSATNISAVVGNPVAQAFDFQKRKTVATNRVDNLSTVETTSVNTAAASNRKPLPDYESGWDKVTGRYRSDMFALLDVSTNADLFGISFDLYSGRRPSTTTHVPANNSGLPFPIQVEGMEVVSTGLNVRAFTVPQISWEPLLNMSVIPPVSGDPPYGLNYYPNDGGPMRIINNGEDSVALAPLPLTNYLIENFDSENGNDDFAAYSFMTLPFGIKALAVLQNTYNFTLDDGTVDSRPGTRVVLNSQEFEKDVKGGLQIQLNAGEAFIDGESDMFVGSTIQLNNVLDFLGNNTGASTLGRSVTEIFNNEFLLEPFNLTRQRGVPLTRIDLSGYGASTFSNWLNPGAAFGATSQARFDILVGRCSHEVIQVVSMIYPWGIKVVRTITIFRVGSGYVYRVDSGWQADSDGEFDFRYFVNVTPDDKEEQPSPFEIHPGVVKGLFNIQNIIETDEIEIFEGSMISQKIVDENGLYVDNPVAGDILDFKLQPVYFDADIDIENPTTGFNNKIINGVDKKLVPSKKVVGYVQVAPRGIPVNSQTLRNLVNQQLGTIGGPIDCEVNLAGSNQKMRFNRFDFNNSFGGNGSDIVFAMAGRGNVLLPKDGAWTLVKHERGNGDVSPVPSDLSVPVIRIGKLIAGAAGQVLDTAIESTLLRIANPSELLRQPVEDTLNFGFLQSTDTQKALFLTPSFEVGVQKLMSKTPPLFVDSFRIVNSKSIFPNIGDGENDLGDAISLINNGTEFLKGGLQDLGKDVWELMDVSDVVDGAKQQGYQLLKEVTDFDLPPFEFELIDVGDGNFRIYIEYEATNSNGNKKGKLDFNINSLANDVADSWKSKMSDIGLVIDLAGIERLLTIRGNWDSKKGSEASYPSPELEFSPELQPVIDILEILQQLQGGDYAGAVANGLKLAMSNKAGSWEYKFEASKEIPVLRFPVPDALYNDPNTPLKLEAGLKIGAYFNAAIKVTTDAKELLPSAGGLLGFYGRLSVMCVSLSAATVYAIGQVNLDIAADTKIGPSLKMKFGFGAQVVIGLPVAGNVSVLFVVGVEIFAASGIIELTAFMLFEGHAEILGGLVSITIKIEAKGTVSKKTIGGGDSRTDLACQVTFGLDISIFLVINISFSTSWQEQRQIA
ncbi:MAG: hypothetical protein AB8F94_08195 [Saprospiraceae bacterium]